MNGDFIDALEQIEREKGIPMQSLLETIEAALASAYRKNHGVATDVRVEVDRQRHQVRIFSRRPKYPPPEEDETEQEEAAEEAAEAEEEGPATALAQALAEAEAEREAEEEAGPEEAEPEPEIEYIEEEINLQEFGRIAAQTAKQVVVQRIREEERERIYNEYSERIGEVVTGEVLRKDARNVFVGLGRVEAILPPHEQIPGENCRFNERIKVYIQDVRKTTKNPQVVVSRTHPMLVKRLFELEVPEVEDGIVEIKSVAREPGARSKVAVSSRDEQVDPVGACVGARGSRVQAIVDELRGEKVDIVRWGDDIKQYLGSALSPAKVAQVLPKDDEMAATVVVPDDQLSLAIGRRGQNVRLAARLTGWKIDIRSQGQYREEERLVQEEVAREAMPRVRVYQLARELDVPIMELLEVLEEEGVKATTHASSISGADAETIRQLLAGAAPA
ncbi:MAG: transcription termination factor NusA [Armatimonadota bacterium]